MALSTLGMLFEACLNQTVIPQEIIISDSGSSDGTEDIIREEARADKSQTYHSANKNSWHGR